MSAAVSVVMPIFDQASFLPRAIESLRAQSLTDWELIVIDDGSVPPIASLPVDPRIRLIRHEDNRGLGAALNTGLEAACAPLIAYLPADDVWYADHLLLLRDALAAESAATLAISGLRYRYNKFAPGRIEGEPIQLVQAMHRRTDARWVERETLTTDDLGRMLWDALSKPVAETGRVTCEWVDHPAQRHKAIRAPDGGLNTYRARYGVQHPLRFHSTTGLNVDEPDRFARYRDAPAVPRPADALTILLVGELAYNPERVLALAERGHRLLGLWCDTPMWFNAVGPQPFGHVEDLPREGWAEAARDAGVDVIYALLNWQTVSFARRIQRENPGLPFVWHFKEGPFICLEKGMWADLLALYVEADGRIYCSEELHHWFEMAHPALRDDTPALILDGDLPKADVLRDRATPLLSQDDGEIHTVVPGRPIGLHPETVAELAHNRIHLHFYGDFIHDVWRAWIDRTRRLAAGYIHIHATVHQERWVEEFSRYDAGWLHFFQSRNNGELVRADWDDLNLPARMATLGVAGVPLLQRDNRGHEVATQSIVRTLGNGLFFRSMADLGRQLRDEPRMQKLRERAWEVRDEFTFDAHVDALVALFRAAIDGRRTGDDSQPNSASRCAFRNLPPGS